MAIQEHVYLFLEKKIRKRINLEKGCMTRTCLVFIGILFICASPASAAFTFTAPASDNLTITGTYTFTVDTATLPTTASIEYRFPSFIVCVQQVAPYDCVWNTGFGQDGSYSMQAIARNALGVVLGTTERLFAIHDRNTTLAVTSHDLTLPLAGVLLVTAEVTDTLYYPKSFHLLMDGEYQAYTDIGGAPLDHQQTASWFLDTRKFANGDHELTIITNAWKELTTPHTETYLSGQLTRRVTLDNGHMLQEIQPSVVQIYLQPLAVLQVMCTAVFTDGVNEPCTSATYVSDTPSVATVGVLGLITAGASGFATITITANGGATTSVYVQVATQQGVPHFASNGQFVDTYTPGVSVWSVAPFLLDPVYMQIDPALLVAVRQAAINTLSFGIYINPRSLTMSLATWKATLQDPLITARMTWAAANGFYLGLTDDDAFRVPGTDAWWTLNWPQAQAATQYAFETCAGTGKCLYVDIVDEASNYWISPILPAKLGTLGAPGVSYNAPTSITCGGMVCTVTWPGTAGIFPNAYPIAWQGSIHPELNTPLGTTIPISNVTTNTFDFAPNASITGGPFDATTDPNMEWLWFAVHLCTGGVPCNPFIPNNAVQTYSDWLNTASPKPPHSWPPLGALPPLSQAAWVGQVAENTGISQYTSHYWDTLSSIRGYGWSDSVQQRTYWMRQAWFGRQSAMNLARPQLMLTCRSSFTYYKRTAGGAYYTPPLDDLVIPSCDGPLVIGESMTAAALGVAGLRQYYADPFTPTQRSTLFPVGSLMASAMRYDASNYEPGERFATESWEANGLANALLTQVLAPYLLATAQSSPGYGRNIVTAVRRGSDALLFLLVNTTDIPQTLALDLSPYQSGRPMARYDLTYNQLQTTQIADTSGETLTIPRGGAVAYLVPFGSAPGILQAATVTPTLPGGATSAVVNHTYVYSGHLAHHTGGVACTPSCTVRIDPRLGEAWAQVTYLDSGGAVVSRDAPLLLALDAAAPALDAQGSGTLFAVP